MKKKFPDNVVWDEEKGYYAKMLPYGSNIGAPAIKPDDISTWKREKIEKTNKYFTKKYEEIRSEYEKLIEEFEWNRVVYSSNYRFEPIIGEKYYLYRKKDGELFLSIITPDEWTQDFVGAFEMDSENKWKKINK